MVTEFSNHPILESFAQLFTSRTAPRSGNGIEKKLCPTIFSDHPNHLIRLNHPDHPKQPPQQAQPPQPPKNTKPTKPPKPPKPTGSKPVKNQFKTSLKPIKNYLKTDLKQILLSAFLPRLVIAKRSFTC